jgi:hypothetical protein
MFQSSAKRLRALLSLADDILGDPEPGIPHPHRQPLRFEHQRRPGSIPAPAAHCISPVRPARQGVARERIS